MQRNFRNLTTVLGIVFCAMVMLSSPATSATREETESLSFYQDAVKRLQAGNAGAAIVQLRNAIQRDPNNLDARLLLGRLYLQAGDGPSAEKELRHVDESHPGDEVELLLGQALLLQQKYDDVLSTVGDKAIAPELRSGELIVRGSAKLGLGDYGAAETLFNEAMSLTPKSTPALLAMSRLKLMRGDFASAEKLVEAALQIDGGFFDGWLMKSSIATSQGDIRTALAALDRAATIRPDDIRVQLGQAQANLRGGQFDAAEKAVKEVLEKSPDNALAKYIECTIDVGRGNFQAASQLFLEVEDKLRDYPPSLLLGGVIRYQTGQFAQAEVSLSRYAAIMPANVEVRRLLALTQLRQGNARSAAETLQQLLDKDPNDAAALQLLASAYVRQEKYSEAADAFERAAKFGNAASVVQARASLALLGTSLGLGGSPKAGTDVLPSDDMTKGVLLILELLKTREFDVALEKIQQLKATYPNNPLVENVEGAIYLAKSDDANARKHFEAALAIDQKFFPAMENLDRLDIRAGNIPAVEKRMRDRLTADPLDERSIIRLSSFLVSQQRRAEAIELLEGKAGGLPKSIEIRKALVRLYLAEADAQKAKKTSGDLVTIAPDDVSLQRFVAQAYVQAGDPQSAVEVMRVLVNKNPSDVALKLSLTQVLASASPEEARTILEDIRRADPSNVDATVGLVNLALAANKVDEAIQDARDLAPHDRIKAAQLEANILERSKRGDEAVKVLDEAFQRDTVSALAVDLGSARLNVGRIDEAIEGLRQWLQQKPTDAAARGVLGAALLRKGDYAGAAAEYDKLLVQDPFNAVTLNNLAWLKDELGAAGAVELARRAHDLAPQSGEIADTLGWLLVKSKNMDDGLKLLREAATAAPTNSDIQFHLAFALHQTGDNPTALKILEKLLATGEKFSEREAAESLLKELRS